MAVTGFVEVWDGRGGTGQWPNRRTYVRTIQVRTSTCAEPTNGVVNAIPIRQGSRHPEDRLAYCVKIVPRQDPADGTLWQVEYEYDSHPDHDTDEPPLPGEGGEPGDLPERPDNPLLKPPVWKYTFEKYTKPVQEEFSSGKPILNTAHLPFDPPLTIERSRPIVELTLNRPSFNPEKADLYIDAVNREPWRGLGARCWRVAGLSASNGFENGVNFVTMTYNLAINRETWDARILNCGYTHLIYEPTLPDGTRPYRPEVYRDAFGQIPSEPPLLDEDGRLLPRDGEPVFLRFRVYPERDFTELFF